MSHDYKRLGVTNNTRSKMSQGYKLLRFANVSGLQSSGIQASHGDKIVLASFKWPIFMQASKFGIGKNTEHLFLLLPLWVKTGHLKMSVDFKISFSCLQLSPKNQQNSFFRISALASKKMSNQKIRAHYITNWRILFWLSYTTFLIWPLFTSWGRNPWKNFVGFLEDLKTPKGHFEINWPLDLAKISTANLLGKGTFLSESTDVFVITSNRQTFFFPEAEKLNLLKIA